MKVLVDHGIPFSLAHGGLQTHIEHTKRGLEEIGVEVEWLRWWDDSQEGDVIHAFAPTSVAEMRFAAGKRIPVVLTSLLDVFANEPPSHQTLRRLAYTAAERVPYLRGFFLNSNQLSCRYAARNLVGLPSQAAALSALYSIPPERVTTVPLGLPEAYLQVPPSDLRGDYLICTGTITSHKRSVELAKLARAAQVPILFVGRPWSPEDTYWTEFQSFVDGRYVRHDGECATEAQLIDRYRQARGFVFLSRYESWSLASSEAAACGLPLLLPSVPWARDRFTGQATFWDRPGDDAEGILRAFFRDCPKLPRPAVETLRWADVAERLREIYRQVIDQSRTF